MQEEIRVHGSIFFLLKKFANNNFSPDAWEKLNEEAGTSHVEFELTKNYPIHFISAIIDAASNSTGLSTNELKERFGEYLVQDLFKLYADYLKPQWKTFEVLENTELVMHGAVRRLNSTANPPILNVSTVTEKLIIIDYYSKRKMGGLAVGIIKGIAKYYNEHDTVQVRSTTDPEDERVQIRVEFSGRERSA
jgi:hypothetical protein